MQARDCFVRINGLRLRYREWGDPSAAPLILLHGGSAHAHWWDFFAPAVADTRSVLALDLRGHGDSEHAHPAAYRIADYVHDLAAFLEQLDCSRLDLVGHSLGAMVAVAYTASAPQRVQRLAVIDSPLKITAAGARYMARLQRFPQPMYRCREDAIARFRLLPIHTTAKACILQYVAAHGIRQLPNGRWTLKFDREAMASTGVQDLTPHVAQLGCPLLFVRGAESTVFTQAALAALLAAAPHPTGAEIPNAHHHVMLDNPPEFERVLRAFLGRHT